ncbi:MAG: very short patch repair endonuclease [Odoribacter laneus]|uniref:very short patch repair endonuclease n=1 Tax=Odoribacter laneus TaxID=626933 RepID=UPI00399B89C1
MTDVHSKATRSYNMAMIKSKNTKPELIVRKYLFSKGFRYRLNVKDLAGKPDIVLPKYRTVIFVHGCFWHGHEECKIAHIPQTRTDYWKNKIQKNITRDLANHQKLKKAGWNIMTIWECQLKPQVRQQTLEGIELLLQKTYLGLYKTYYIPATPHLDQVAEPHDSYDSQP